MKNFVHFSYGSPILLSVMLKAVMYPSLSIPFCFGQPAKRSYPEVMTTDMGDDNFAMKTCMVVVPCVLRLQTGISLFLSFPHLFLLSLTAMKIFLSILLVVCDMSIEKDTSSIETFEFQIEKIR